ncbi:hypothetical protein [Lelliottia nimipressuralis]
MTFTKEQLIARARFLIKRYEDSLANYPDQDGVAMDLELARMALAGMEAELERGKIRRFELDMSDCDSCGQDCGADMVEDLDGDYVLWDEVLPHLYRHAEYDKPQPLTTSERAELENYRSAQQAVPEAISTRQAMAKLEAHEPCDSINVAYKYGWNACRSAMLHGAENVESRCTIQNAPALDSSPKIAESPSGNSPVIPDCSCGTCRPVTFTDSRFVVCSECGNKRCPHANDHRNACTGSNEPGQEGSAYPAAPQQEVK